MKLYNSFIGLNPDKKSLKQVQEKLIDLNTSRAAVIDKLRCELILELHKEREISVKIGDNFSCDGDNFRDITDIVELKTKQQTLLRKRITEFLSKTEHYTQEERIKIRRLLGHYGAVIACVESDGCDRKTILDTYRQDMLTFETLAK